MRLTMPPTTAHRRTPHAALRTRLVRQGLGAAAVTAALLGCGADRAAGPRPGGLQPGALSADVSNLTTAPVLYAQGSTRTSGLGPGSAIGDAYLADDFSVPASWTVSQISMTGRLSDPTLTFAIRSDDKGAPGAVVGTYTLSPSNTDPNAASLPGYAMTDYLFTLPSPLTLTPGTYWLSLLAYRTDTGAAFFWQGTATRGSGGLRSDDGGATWYGVMPYPEGVADFSFALFGESPKAQTITFPAITPDPAAPLNSASLLATASSKLAVSYTSLTTGVCIVSVTTVSYLAPGTCTVAADQAGSSAFLPATRVTRDVAVSQSAQAITFTSSPPSPAYVGGTYAVSASGGGSDNAVAFASTTPAVCTVTGTTVALVAAGPCTITADEPGNLTYADAPQVTQSFTVTLRAQAITFTSLPPVPAVLGGTYAVSATGGASTKPVTFSSLTTATCTVSGSVVRLVAVGPCTVAADQAGGDAYAPAARKTQTFAVVYAFSGFVSPVANPPAVNAVLAGSAVPVKFSLGGYQGLAIFAAGSPSSQPVSCSTGATTGASVATVPDVPLAYDASLQRYTYTWKTEKKWSGCRRLTVTLADGTVHTALLQFR